MRVLRDALGWLCPTGGWRSPSGCCSLDADCLPSVVLAGEEGFSPPSCPAVMTCQEREDGRGAPGPDEMIQQRFHFISNLTLNFNSLKDKKPRDIRCNEIKQSFSDSKFDHKWALRLLL